MMVSGKMCHQLKYQHKPGMMQFRQYQDDCRILMGAFAFCIMCNLQDQELILKCSQMAKVWAEACQGESTSPQLLQMYCAWMQCQKACRERSKGSEQADHKLWGYPWSRSSSSPSNTAQNHQAETTWSVSLFFQISIKSIISKLSLLADQLCFAIFL